MKKVKEPVADVVVAHPVVKKKLPIINDYTRRHKKWLYMGIAGLVLAFIGFLFVICWKPFFHDVFNKAAKHIYSLS